MSCYDFDNLVTLNQRVPGSSPGAPTNQINNLTGGPAEQTVAVLQFCSRFELQQRDLGELNVTAEIVGVEDRFYVLQAMTGKRRDLRHGRVGQRRPNDC